MRAGYSGIKRKMKILILITLTYLSSGAYADFCKDKISQLKWLETANPSHDALSAIKSGNLKYKATIGMTYIIPGVSQSEYLSARKTDNFETIKGTGDAICSDQHLELNQKALHYAQSYNKIIGQAHSGS